MQVVAIRQKSVSDQRPPYHAAIDYNYEDPVGIGKCEIQLPSITELGYS